MSTGAVIDPREVLERGDELRRGLGEDFRDQMVSSLYTEAQRIADRAVHVTGDRKWDFDQKIDQFVTSPWLGLPMMLGILALIFWLTIIGANYPSQMLANGFFWFEDQAATWFLSQGVPAWLTGFLWHGIFRGLAWVVSVMLPPMAIFFPMFTILEDLGYLPRVAFNMDWLFRKAGAHGKQALSMAMGFGCNAAGVSATRVIDSPRERLIAILTEQLCPLQRPFPDAHHAGGYLRRGGFSSCFRLGGGGRRGGRRGLDRRRIHVTGFVAAGADRAARRSVGVHARIASLPASQHFADSLHLLNRSDHFRIGPCHRDGRSRGGCDLGPREHRVAGHQSGPAFGELPRSAGPVRSAWTELFCSRMSSRFQRTRLWCQQ